MALKHDCGTCRHDETGWLCDKCVDNNMWERHQDLSEYEEKEKATIPEPKVIDVPGVVIKLELDDESCMSVANAICNYCVNRMGDDETALIFMEELTEHIDSAVRAKKKWLEYQKSKEV